ncbi:hypothetical protein J6590_021307 [Homalodisca vitripennis]|nr:hypothetical protein J6590_021307 [Homalodisca vitripennis]
MRSCRRGERESSWATMPPISATTVSETREPNGVGSSGTRARIPEENNLVAPSNQGIAKLWSPLDQNRHTRSLVSRERGPMYAD